MMLFRIFVKNNAVKSFSLSMIVYDDNRWLTIEYITPLTIHMHMLQEFMNPVVPPGILNRIYNPVT